MSEEGRLAAGNEESSSAEPVAGSSPGGLDRVVSMLEAVVRVLPVLVPDPADGSAWVQFDEAAADLYRALAALGQIDGAAVRRPAAGLPTAVRTEARTEAGTATRTAARTEAGTATRTAARTATEPAARPA
jgi:hypothetical protein